MVRSKSYCVNLRPLPWQRPYLNERTLFDNQKREKLAFGIYLAQQHNDEPLFGRPIIMELTFYMAIPKSLPKRKGGLYHSNRPDLDNLCKFVLDAMKEVVITDDKIICDLHARKVYDKVPRTEIIIKEVD